MAEPNSANVSNAKPRGKGGRYAGGLYFGDPKKAEIPTDATTTLDENFTSAGYLSDDGIKNKRARKTEDVVAFGGDTVLSVTTSMTETFELGLLETTKDTLSIVYGDDNVTETGDSITVKHNAKDAPHKAYVFELAMTGSRVKRIVIPDGQVGDVDDVAYKDGEAITYSPTITAFPDDSGNTAYEYIAKVTSVASKSSALDTTHSK
jgi:hypothetical protein|nr:MAG TPA: tail protein [Caudoviricetes sp.]